MFDSDKTCGEFETGSNVGNFKERILGQYLRRGRARSEHVQYVLDRHPHPANDGLAAEYLGVRRDPLCYHVLWHLITRADSTAQRRPAETVTQPPLTVVLGAPVVTPQARSPVLG